MSCSVCVKPKSQSPEPNLTGADTLISLATSHSQALIIYQARITSHHIAKPASFIKQESFQQLDIIGLPAQKMTRWIKIKVHGVLLHD